MEQLIGGREERILERTMNWIREGVKVSMDNGTYVAAMLTMCCAIDILSSFYAGRRRSAFVNTGRDFVLFIKRYFHDLVDEATDSKGHYIKKSVPVSYKGGKAKKKMDYPSILNYWYRKGLIQEIVFKEGLDETQKKTSPYFLDDPAFCLLVNIEAFYRDFQKALEELYEDLHSDFHLQENFWKRFLAIYGREKSTANGEKEV